MVRIVLAVFVVYVALLAIFVGLRQHQLKAASNNRMADATDELIDNNSVLRDQVTKTSPDNTNNWTRSVSAYELVTMSPCNPRIKRCS